MSKYHDIAIALAGVCQNALLVPQLANTGTCTSNSYISGIKSIVNTSPSSTADVFDGLAHLQVGLNTLIKILTSNQKEHVDIMRYVFGSLGIANKLRSNDAALEDISKRIVRLSSLYPDTSSEKIAEHLEELSYAFAGIYSDIISPLTTKIKVTGKIEYLQNTLVQAKVRTALFACIRSAMLWYQVGGTRWQFLFSRKKIAQAAHDLLTTNY